MASNLDLCQRVYTADRPWVSKVADQVCMQCGTGLCEQLLATNASAALAWVKDTAYVNATVAGGPGAITIASFILQFFAEGQGNLASGAPAGYNNKTAAETTLSSRQESAAPGRFWCYVVTGLGVNVWDLFSVTASTTDVYPNAAGNQADGSLYNQKIKEAILTKTALTFAMDSGCTYVFGSLADWPSFTGARGVGMTSNGQISVAFSFVPLLIAFCMNSDDESDSVSVTASLTHTVTIEQDGTNPLAAGTYLVPVEIKGYGFVVCCCPAQCFTPGGYQAPPLSPVAAAQLMSQPTPP